MKNIILFSFVAFFVVLSAQAASVTGVVTESGGGALGGMTVVAYNLAGGEAARVATDSQGRYSLALPAATYRLLAFDPNGNYATSFYNGASSFDTSQGVVVGSADVSGINFALVKGGRINGHVGAVSGSVLPSIKVNVYNLDGTTRAFAETDIGGNFSIVVPPGSYKVAAFDEALGYVTQFYSAQSAFLNAATASVTAGAITGNITFTLVASGVVKGHVADHATGGPIAGAVVEIYDLSGFMVAATVTTASGDFALAAPAGNYKIAAFDRRGSYQVSFYRDSPSFASAASFAVATGSEMSDLQFSLLPSTTGNPTTVFVSGAANVAGAGGTFFQTDVSIYNPSTSQSLSVSVSYLPAGSDNRSATSVPFVVGPRQQLTIRNILQSRFNVTGVGGLRFTGNRDLKVMTRTFNVPPDAATAGTFGLAIPGHAIADSLSLGVINGLANNASARSNVGLLNPQPYPITVTLQLFGGTGALLGTNTRQLAPLDQFQANTIFSFVGSSALSDDAYCVVSSTDGSFFAYGSLVDNLSGDGTIIEAVPTP